MMGLPPDAANFPNSPIVTLWSNDLANLSQDLYACGESGGTWETLDADTRRVIAVNAEAVAGDDDLTGLGS